MPQVRKFCRYMRAKAWWPYCFIRFGYQTASVSLLSRLGGRWSELPDGRDGHPRKSNDGHGEP